MYSALRKKKGLSCREFAEFLKTEFPVANAAGVSLAERPEESGVTYSAEARRYIKAQFGVQTKSENRKDRGHLTCWLPEAVRKMFDEAKEKRGFITNKDYVVFLIMQDMARIEKAASSVGAEQGGIENICNTIITETEAKSNDC